MDHNIWTVLECAAKIAVRRLPRPRRRFEFSDRQILLMWLWAAMHERPMCWACSREHCRGMFRPRRLPSVSQFCKRLTTERFELAQQLLHEVLTERGHDDLLHYLDGKPLLINGYSTDPDAANGIAHGRYGFGYKLHARTTKSGFIPEYKVLALNEGEPNTARELIRRLGAGVMVLADANYDSALLYADIDEKGSRLLTRLKGQHMRKPGSTRKLPRGRAEALELWERQPELAEQAMKERDTIERTFAHLGGFGGGLGPLPAWVRRLTRVRRWVAAKIAIYHARLIAKACRAVA